MFDYFEDDPSFPVSKSERFHFLPKLEMVELVICFKLKSIFVKRMANYTIFPLQYETTKPYLFTSSKMPYSDM